VASSVELVLNQRLVRKLCGDCKGKGCAACLNTGYRGRLPLVEWLRVTDAMRRRLAARDVEGLVAQPALTESARALMKSALTNQAELNRVLGFDAGSV
jgi:type II secretory ATPase GspE/PulE/Tfp pilus assembly ATPase PilB-like protein